MENLEGQYYLEFIIRVILIAALYSCQLNKRKYGKGHLVQVSNQLGYLCLMLFCSAHAAWLSPHSNQLADYLGIWVRLGNLPLSHLCLPLADLA